NLRAEKDDLYQKMSQEITFLQEREKGLQRELDQIKVSHQELNCKYEKDVSALKQQAETYQQEISCEKNVNLERANKDLQLINNLRAEKENLYQKMSQEITFRQEREKQLKSELVQIKVLYQELSCKYEKDVSALKQQAETSQQEIIHQTNAKSEQDLKLINELRAEKEDLHQKMLQEITFQQQKSTETVKHLQCQLEQVKVSYQELKATYEIDVLALRQQAETFERELEKEVKTNSQAGSNNLQFIKELEAEKDTSCQQLTVLQQLYSDREINYETELKNLKSEIQSLTALNEKLSAEHEDRNDLEPPKRKVPRCGESSQQTEPIPVKNISDPTCTDLLDKTLSGTSEFNEASLTDKEDFAEEILQESSIPIAEEGKETKSTPSVWKKVRHAMGLRKPKKWKKN
ncbi:hypothetical protein AMECASPLE_023086, partial [Ameca splendens]